MSSPVRITILNQAQLDLFDSELRKAEMWNFRKAFRVSSIRILPKNHFLLKIAGRKQCSKKWLDLRMQNRLNALIAVSGGPVAFLDLHFDQDLHIHRRF
jgi:hypothetical protein